MGYFGFNSPAVSLSVKEVKVTADPSLPLPLLFLERSVECRPTQRSSTNSSWDLLRAVQSRAHTTLAASVCDCKMVNFVPSQPVDKVFLVGEGAAKTKVFLTVNVGLSEAGSTGISDRNPPLFDNFCFVLQPL